MQTQVDLEDLCAYKGHISGCQSLPKTPCWHSHPNCLIASVHDLVVMLVIVYILDVSVCFPSICPPSHLMHLCTCYAAKLYAKPTNAIWTTTTHLSQGNHHQVSWSMSAGRSLPSWLMLITWNQKQHRSSGPHVLFACGAGKNTSDSTCSQVT